MLAFCVNHWTMYPTLWLLQTAYESYWLYTVSGWVVRIIVYLKVQLWRKKNVIYAFIYRRARTFSVAVGANILLVSFSGPLFRWLERSSHMTHQVLLTCLALIYVYSVAFFSTKRYLALFFIWQHNKTFVNFIYTFWLTNKCTLQDMLTVQYNVFLRTQWVVVKAQGIERWRRQDVNISRREVGDVISLQATGICRCNGNRCVRKVWKTLTLMHWFHTI